LLGASSWNAGPRGALASENGLQTSVGPDIFVAGDVKKGTSLIVGAITEGRKAALDSRTYTLRILPLAWPVWTNGKIKRA
jgi:NADPH-dependent glutamate synthase beta subunit-like oxidoreductase